MNRDTFGRWRGVLLALMTAGGGLAATEAFAGLEICNQTRVRAAIAIGYKSGDEWVSEGWWNIDPGACQAVVDGDLKHRYYYVRPRGEADFIGEFDYAFCTQDAEFTIRGDEDCVRRGYLSERFFKIDTGSTAKHAKFNLHEDVSSNFTAPEPETADSGPGTYGEPFTATGPFDGCDRIDGLLACTVMVDGWRYVGIDDGRSDPAVLAYLDGLEIGATVAIEGDFITQGDISVDVALRSATLVSSGGDGLDYIRAGLLGAWRNEADPQRTWRFAEGGVSYTYSGGDLDNQGTWEVAAACPDGTPHDATAVLLYRDEYNPQPICLAVAGLSETVLILDDVVSGATYTYGFDSP
jgi:uncharacterized membrane protein